MCRDWAPKNQQTRSEWHHDTFKPSLHLVRLCELCLVLIVYIGVLWRWWCWVCSSCWCAWEWVICIVGGYCRWAWQIWFVLYAEGCGLSSGECLVHLYLVGVNRLICMHVESFVVYIYSWLNGIIMMSLPNWELWENLIVSSNWLNKIKAYVQYFV